MTRSRLAAFVAIIALLPLAGCNSRTADTPKTASTPTPTLTPAPTVTDYPVHSGITATWFYVGDDGHKKANGGISNVPGAWDDDWIQSFYGWHPPVALFKHGPPNIPSIENPWYCALPFYDYTDHGSLISQQVLHQVYWYHPVVNGQSLLKNRWIKVWNGNHVAYCQWEDTGPTVYDDVDYVFGTAPPKNHAVFNEGSGLDVSWELNQRLQMHGEAKVSWQFVDTPQPGPWTEIVTTSPPVWK